jgi:hypothetical protein
LKLGVTRECESEGVFDDVLFAAVDELGVECELFQNVG